ncbi:MAG: FtsQ-type POTRA domain-containing protein [Synechococcus sp.]
MSRTSGPPNNIPLPPGVQRRRRLRQERRRDLLIQLWRLTALGASATALGWVLLTQGWMLQSKEQVQVSGSQRLGRKAVIEASQLRFPQSLLSLQPSEIESRLLSTLPVQSAAVQRRLLPPGLIVQLKDRRPLAAARRQSAQGLEHGMVDRRGQWMAYTAAAHGEEPETTIQVLGWTPAQRQSLETLLKQRDQLGSPLQTIEIAADGALSVRIAAFGLVQLGRDPRLLDQQLTALRQLNRSLPKDLRHRSGTSLDLSDPMKPELQMARQPESEQADSAKIQER